MRFELSDARASQGPEPPRLEPEEEQDEETGLDKTIADSFPASDPPSSIPGPGEDDESAA